MENCFFRKRADRPAVDVIVDRAINTAQKAIGRLNVASKNCIEKSIVTATRRVAEAIFPDSQSIRAPAILRLESSLKTAVSAARLKTLLRSNSSL